MKVLRSVRHGRRVADLVNSLGRRGDDPKLTGRKILQPQLRRHELGQNHAASNVAS
jgi:hypothetical protein